MKKNSEAKTGLCLNEGDQVGLYLMVTLPLWQPLTVRYLSHLISCTVELECESGFLPPNTVLCQLVISSDPEVSLAASALTTTFPHSWAKWPQ